MVSNGMQPLSYGCMQEIAKHEVRVTQGDLGTEVLNAVKSNLKELTTKSIHSAFSCNQPFFFTHAHVLEFQLLLIWSILAFTMSVNFQCCLEWQLIIWAVFLTPSLPVYTALSVCWVPVALSSMGAHSWVARICQPWEQSPFRS